MRKTCLYQWVGKGRKTSIMHTGVRDIAATPTPPHPPFAKSLVEKYKNNNSNNNSNHHHYHLIQTCKYMSNWNVVSSSCFLNSHPIPSRLIGVVVGCSKLYLARYILSFCYGNLSIRETSDLKEHTSKQTKTTTFSLAQASSI